MKERLDVLVQQRLGVSRSKAQGLIRTGFVYDATGAKLDKPGLRIEVDSPLEIREEQAYVSRGGDKLAAALDFFPIDVPGAVAIDLGASTGGFTDCLLQHGAARVYAVDVGYGQLAWKLRQDPRVTVMERTNARNLTPEHFPVAPGLFTADCSFISLCLILPALSPLLAPGTHGVVLIKPQFEAGRGRVGKGGVVRSRDVHADVIREVFSAARAEGYEPLGVMPSPLEGPAGNREFLAWLGRR